MYEYKSEIINKGIRLVKGSATESDASKLDEIFNKRSAEGWELVSYVYTTELLNVSASVLATFRKTK